MAKTDIKIGNTIVASPAEWTPSIQDLVANSTRAGGGRMRANFIASKRTWQAKWINLTELEYRAILSEIEGKFEFDIRCYDPQLGIVTKRFYKGDRQFESLKHFYNGTYGSITVTFIEC